CRLRLLGQAEGALADDVALHLVRSAVDRVRTRVEEEGWAPRQLVRGRLRDLRVRAEDVNGELAQAPVERRPGELRDRRERRHLATLERREGPQRVVPQDPEADTRAGGPPAPPRPRRGGGGARGGWYRGSRGPTPGSGSR